MKTITSTDMSAFREKSDRYDVSGTVAFLAGVKDDKMQHFTEKSSVVSALNGNKPAKIIRHLNNIRSNIMLNFQKTENEIIYNFKNLSFQELYIEDTKALSELGIEISKPNYRCNQYLLEINKIISAHIPQIKDIFPEWINFDYIKELFVIPKCTKIDTVKKETRRFINNLSQYPYQRFLYLRKLTAEGNVLYCDNKFVKHLYQMHDRKFTDKSKLKDVSEDVKTNIYGFIDNNDRVIIAVDCENSDPFKLASVLTSLEQGELNKIEKILLFDDKNTTSAWTYIQTITKVPVEYNLITRVTNRKSLVDMKMCTEITKLRYDKGIKAFILLSSDSDFYGLISSLSDSEFLVMIEKEKTGEAIKQALKNNGTYYCFIDSFCTGNINQLKVNLLNNHMENALNKQISINLNNTLKSVIDDLRMSVTPEEIKNYYKKYSNGIKLGINDTGDVSIKVT